MTKYTKEYLEKLPVIGDDGLRSLVVNNKIFKGGIARLKKHEIIEKIINSDWYKIQNGEIVDLPVKSKISEKKRLKQELDELNKKIAEEEKKINQEQPLTNDLPHADLPPPILEQSEIPKKPKKEKKPKVLLINEENLEDKSKVLHNIVETFEQDKAKETNKDTNYVDKHKKKPTKNIIKIYLSRDQLFG
jgi:hypothetical protein